MSFFWPQKLYAVARHLQLVQRKLPGVDKHEPEHFTIDTTKLTKTSEYIELNRLLDFESAELRDRVNRGEYPVTHKTNGVTVKTGCVTRGAGFEFTETGTHWQCKLPDRADFYKWDRGETQTANRKTQKFVALMLAVHGVDHDDFKYFPFDRFVIAQDADELAKLLNEMLIKS